MNGLTVEGWARSSVPAARYGNKQAQDWFHLRHVLKLLCRGTIGQAFRLSIKENA
jgi:phage terminase Nu1 subunit (DNA packaging protein)